MIRIHTLTINNSYSEALRSGILIWRKLDQFGDPTPIKFQATDKNNYMGKFNLINSDLWEPVVSGFESNGSVLFVNQIPPEDWTCLILTNVSKRMKEPIGADSNGNKGMCVFASIPNEPCPLKDYIRFYKKVRELKMTLGDCDLNEIYQKVKDIEIPISRYDNRLLVVKNWMKERIPRPLYDYTYLKGKP